MLGEIFRKARQEIQNPATLKRLTATDIFYAQGVKANVLFFDARPAREKPWTERIWVYDLRTNKHFTLKMKSAVQREVSVNGVRESSEK